MSIRIRQSTASQEIPLGIFLDETDGITPVDDLTIAAADIKIWKAGATTLANKNSGGATSIAAGIYYATLDATDSNTLGAAVIFVHVAGALPVRLELEVLPAQVYDSLVLGTDLLQVDTTQVSGTVQTAGDIASRLPDALVSGRMDASVGAMAANTLTSSALAADAVTEIKTGLASESVLEIVATNVDQTTADVAAVKAKTDNLPADPADASDIASAFSSVNSTLGTIAGYVDTEVGAIKTVVDAVKVKTDGLPSDPADASVIAGLIAAVDAKIDIIDTTADAVKVKTDALPTDPADASVVAGLMDGLDDKLDIITNFVDTEVAAIKTVVDAVKIKTDALPTDPADQSLIMAAIDGIGGGDAPTAEEIAEAVLRTALTEGYATNGSVMTLEQAMHMIWSLLSERSLIGTTLHAKKLDRSTDAMTFALDDAEETTAQTRAT